MTEVFLGVKDPNLLSYSRFYHFWKKRALIGKLSVDEVKRNRQSLKVLDIGCGNGTDLFYINSLFNAFQKSMYVGLDLSEENIKCCNDTKKSRNITNINFSVGDIERLGFKNETFDVVICSELLEHLHNQEQAVSEVKRVLKTGGTFIVTTPNKTNYFSRITDFFRFLGLWKHKRKIAINNLVPVFGKGFGHIAVKSLAELKRIFHREHLKIECIKRGAPISGGIYYDSFNLIFAILVIIDVILDYLPFAVNFTETIIMKIRKE